MSMKRDPRISDIFYYFEQHSNLSSGRKVGRKIGVVQEILCKKLLQTSKKIRDCLIYEPKMPGRSGATHKVEFVLFQPLGAITLNVGSSYALAPGLSGTLKAVKPSKKGLAATLSFTDIQKAISVRAGTVFPLSKVVPNSHLLLKVVDVSAKSCRLSILDATVPIASIESKRVGAQRFSGSDKLGSGIQTIEKAKQASLVAVDFDLKFNGTLLAQTGPKQKRAFRSFVVLGNGVHWTDHDLAILETYVDYTYLARDAAIVRYADFVLALAKSKGVDFMEFFMAYFQGMTKTPNDDFAVGVKDFVALRPKVAGSLVSAVEAQIQPYPVNVA